MATPLSQSSQIEMQRMRRSLKSSYSNLEGGTAGPARAGGEKEDLTVSASWDGGNSGRLAMLALDARRNMDQHDSSLSTAGENIGHIAAQVLRREIAASTLMDTLRHKENAGEDLVRENAFWPLLQLASEGATETEILMEVLVLALTNGGAAGAQLTLTGEDAEEKEALAGEALAEAGGRHALEIARILGGTPNLRLPVLRRQIADADDADIDIPEMARAVLAICLLKHPPSDASDMRVAVLLKAVAQSDAAAIVALTHGQGKGWKSARKALCPLLSQFQTRALNQIWQQGLTPERYQDFASAAK